MLPPEQKTSGPVVTAADREAMRKIVDERRRMFGDVIDGEEWLVETGATALAAVRAEVGKERDDHAWTARALREQRDTLHARVTALEGALRKYGQHTELCARMSEISDHCDDGPFACDCGFDQALAPGAGGTA